MSFEKSFEHNDALFAAALAEFAAVGYEQASINIILKKAGMSKGQFYYHFNNKEGLYLALIGILIARKQEFMASVMQPIDFQQDIFGIFKTQMQYGIEFAKEHPEINQFSESFLKEKGSPIYDTALETYNFDNNVTLYNLIATAYENNEFRAELPLSFIQKTIGYLFTHAADMTDLSNTENAEENLNYLIDFIETGLARHT
jgi:AcrR family transcriptional regulator